MPTTTEHKGESAIVTASSIVLMLLSSSAKYVTVFVYCGAHECSYRSGSRLVAPYDSQGNGGGIRTRLHAGNSTTMHNWVIM
jgi:hypothetical protein